MYWALALGEKTFLYMRPEAEIDQRIIANALWIALAPLRKFNNLLP
jgi:hypothetical protein